MSTKFGKKSISFIATYAIVLLIYIVSFLLIPFEKQEASWISFGFTVLSIISSLAIAGYAFKSDDKLVSKVYGFPIFVVGAIYAAVQIILGVIICVLAAFIDFPTWLAWLLPFILLGASAIGVILTDNGRDFATEIDESTKANTQAISYFQLSVASIADYAKDESVKDEILKLDEAFRYSDPVSNEHTAPAERKIAAMLTELREAVENGDSQLAHSYIEKIERLLNERNRICKMSK